MNIDPSRISARLMEAREAKGMSRKTLADRLGIGYATLWRYENDTIPSLVALCEIASVLNKPLGYFLDKQDEVIVVSNTQVFEMLRRIGDKDNAWHEIVRSLDNTGSERVQDLRKVTNSKSSKLL